MLLEEKEEPVSERDGGKPDRHGIEQGEMFILETS